MKRGRRKKKRERKKGMKRGRKEKKGERRKGRKKRGRRG